MLDEVDTLPLVVDPVDSVDPADPVDPVAPADPVVPVDPVQECEPQPSGNQFKEFKVWVDFQV